MPEKILFVDDEPAILSAFTRLLRNLARDEDFGATRLAMAVGVLARMVDVERVMRVLDQ